MLSPKHTLDTFFEAGEFFITKFETRKNEQNENIYITFEEVKYVKKRRAARQEVGDKK